MKPRLYRPLLILAAALGIGTLVYAGNPPNYPKGPIELKYYAQGPWAVSIKIGKYCCDFSGNKFDLYYPTNLGGNGFMHPLLTWGNGSFGRSTDCAYLLTHMASWGFVVIATADTMTGPGQSILSAAKFLVNENTDSNSIFFHKLKTSQVGSFGASQGATGALNAMMKSGGLNKTAIPIELPSQIWCSSPTNCVDTKNMTLGSVFFNDGSMDAISPPTQPPWELGEQSIAAYYDAAPGSVVKLKGTLNGPNHNDVTGQPSCKKAKWLCANGVLWIHWLSHGLDDGPASGRHICQRRLYPGYRRNIF